MSTLSRPFIALIPAAGKGARMGSSLPKQYLPVSGISLIERTLDLFLQHALIQQVIVVVAEDDTLFGQLACAQHPKLSTCIGGKTRMHSVYNGLVEIYNKHCEDCWVVVHDAARCLLHRDDLSHCLTHVQNTGRATVLGTPAVNTVKEVEFTQGVSVKQSVPRESLWLAQTPQIMMLNNLLDSLSDSISKNIVVNDEAEAMERIGQPVSLVQAQHANLKVTTPADRRLVEALV